MDAKLTQNGSAAKGNPVNKKMVLMQQVKGGVATIRVTVISKVNVTSGGFHFLQERKAKAS